MRHRDRIEVGQRVVAHVLVDVRIDHHRERRRVEERAAVGLAVLHVFRCDTAARTGAVLNDHALSVRPLHPGADQPREHIGAAAGRITDDDREQLYRRRRGGGQRGEGRHRDGGRERT
jgi:hypothetical protein